MNKYDPLYDYLAQNKKDTISLSFEEIERMIGSKLPQSAHMYTAWWGNSIVNTTHLQSKAWTECNYKTVDVAANILAKRMTFVRKNIIVATNCRGE